MTKTKIPPRANGAFTALLDEACEATRELRRLERSDVRKLTAQAFVARAAANAKIGPLRVKELRERIDNYSFRSDIGNSLRRLVGVARSPNYLWPPVSHLGPYVTPETRATLAAWGADVLALLAVASQIAAEKFPQDFGQSTDVQADTNRLVELTVRVDIYRQRLAKEYTGADVEMKDGRSTFKITGGAVALGPDAPKHLIDWRLSQKDMA